MNLEETNNATVVTQEVLAHHLECLGRRDLAGTMADYTLFGYWVNSFGWKGDPPR